MLHGRKPDVGEMLFGNVRIRQVKVDAASGVLLLRAIYDEREYMDVVYQDVFYTQLDESCINVSITLAQRTDAAELKNARHSRSIRRMMKDCQCSSPLVLEEMENRGYHFYMHYAGRDEEYLVIAKGMSIT